MLSWSGNNERIFWSSSYHLPTCLPHTVKNSGGPFQCWASDKKTIYNSFYSVWFDPSGNRTRAYRFSSRCSIHSTTAQHDTSIFYSKLWIRHSTSNHNNAKHAASNHTNAKHPFLGSDWKYFVGGIRRRHCGMSFGRSGQSAQQCKLESASVLLLIGHEYNEATGRAWIN